MVQLRKPNAWTQAACVTFKEASAFAVTWGLCCIAGIGDLLM